MRPDCGSRTIRLVAALGCLTGILLSLPLWIGPREFPRVPLFPDWDGLPAWLETGNFAVMILSLCLAVRWPRPFMPLAFASVTLHCIADQCRLQPWLYQYMLLIGLVSFAPPGGITASRVLMSAVYFWAGAHKLNAAYFAEVAPWFVEPAQVWVPSAVRGQAMLALKSVSQAGPFIEMAFAAGLWIPRWRWPMLGLCVAMHAWVLLFLGPLGRDYNRVIWPWNVAMVVLVFVLFPPGEARRNAPATPPLETQDLPSDAIDAGCPTPRRREWLAPALACVVAVLPVLRFPGLLDSYLSFAVYAGNELQVGILVAESAVPSLPEGPRKFIVAPEIVPKTVPEGMRPLDFESWAIAALGAPVPPEPRIARGIARHLRQFSPSPDDVRLRWIPGSVERTGDPEATHSHSDTDRPR